MLLAATLNVGAQEEDEYDESIQVLESDLASFLCIHADEVEAVSFRSDKTGLTRQEYLHVYLPFAVADALQTAGPFPYRTAVRRTQPGPGAGGSVRDRPPAPYRAEQGPAQDHVQQCQAGVHQGLHLHAGPAELYLRQQSHPGGEQYG